MTGSLMAGAAYGVGYCAVVDSPRPPLYFGDALPWQPGAATVLPSLVGHAAYGAVVALAARHFVAGSRRWRMSTAKPRCLMRLNRAGRRAIYLELLIPDG